MGSEGWVGVEGKERERKGREGSGGLHERF